uniref:Uncharacterized protein n=1 Tax=Chaetoceros debilis TaxID=122233 RepID=A0A7S3V603_9STRA
MKRHFGIEAFCLISVNLYKMARLGAGFQMVSALSLPSASHRNCLASSELQRKHNCYSYFTSKCFLNSSRGKQMLLLGKKDRLDNDNYDDYKSVKDNIYDEYDDESPPYDDYIDEDTEDEVEVTSWEWEPYRKSTHVYLPPPGLTQDMRSRDQGNSDADTSENGIPKTIVHFIGGTLFGSYPLQFYKPLLESIAEQSNSIIVATSIPVTLSSNPLNHFAITKEIATNFRNAYRNIIADEYGKSAANKMKIVGLGHSLGSRLHAILSTSEKCKKIGFEREGNIFVSFNNYNAVESVPGVKNLEEGIENTFYGESSDNIKGKNRQRSDAYYDEYEIGISDVVNAVSEGLQEQISSLKTVVTPDWDKKELEFQPTPTQLWDGLTMNYKVVNTLLVQFDKDYIDQSSKLARIIADSGSKEPNEMAQKDTNSTVVKDGMKNEDSESAKELASNMEIFEPDVKFARLRGTHLTPVSYSDTFIVKAFKRAASIDQILSEAIQEEADYRPKSKSKRKIIKNQDSDNLAKSISKYITDVVQYDKSQH